jgi:hypothetical protein
MLKVRPVYLGVIQLDRESLYTTIQSTFHDTMGDLNSWFFDYLYANSKPIKQLPPLDDWVRSADDATIWTIAFPDPEWYVWVRTDYIEFKNG